MDHVKDMVRAVESMLLFSRNLLMKFVEQDIQKLMCTPSAGQMIGQWMKELNLTKIFRHDSRLHHTPIVSEKPSFRMEKKLCQKYMGIHGCYANDMPLLWKYKGANL